MDIGSVSSNYDFFQLAAIKAADVDDDPMMRLGLTAALSNQEDFIILGEATDGHQGIEQAATLQPDVVHCIKGTNVEALPNAIRVAASARILSKPT